MQQYIRVEKGRLEDAERSANTFMQALVEANETVARQREEIERLRAEIEHRDVEIIALREGLTSVRAVLAESEHLGADELRQATFHAYQAALARWKALEG